MSLAILFYFLCTQHISDINISIIRSLRLCCWITTLVVLFLFCCVLEIWCGWVWVVSVLQAEVQASACNTDTTQTQPRQVSFCNTDTTQTQPHQTSACNTDTTQTQQHKISNTQQNKNKTTNVVIQQRSPKLLMMDILMSETFWVHKK